MEPFASRPEVTGAMRRCRALATIAGLALLVGATDAGSSARLDIGPTNEDAEDVSYGCILDGRGDRPFSSCPSGKLAFPTTR
jgi:hypothetical protein